LGLADVGLLALGLVDVLGELLNDLRLERFEVIRFAAADEPLVDVDLGEGAALGNRLPGVSELDPHIRGSSSDTLRAVHCEGVCVEVIEGLGEARFALLPQGGLRVRRAWGTLGGLAARALTLPAELEGQWDLNLLFGQAPGAGGPRRRRLR
jgi:hypothetical protein